MYESGRIIPQGRGLLLPKPSRYTAEAMPYRPNGGHTLTRKQNHNKGDTL